MGAFDDLNGTLFGYAYGNGADVDFETVWGEGHTMAERTGDSTDNFINWVNGCLN